MIAQRWLRIVMVVVMLGVCCCLDWAVLNMIREAAAFDAQFIAEKVICPEQRLITENVYLSLVGGTVLQAATVLIVITNYLFPKPR